MISGEITTNDLSTPLRNRGKSMIASGRGFAFMLLKKKGRRSRVLTHTL
jgi:hypothetical protein